jgi:nitrile hydratase
VDGVHDMGGMHGFGPVVVPGGDEPYHARWEPRVFAIHLLISTERLGAGPGGRATREEMEPAHYLAASYYERWLWSAERRLERGGSIAPGEVEAMAARLAVGEPEPRSSDPALVARSLPALRGRKRLPTPAVTRFAPGDRVRARRMRPAGHTRCPRYVRGAVGVVERLHGADLLPDRLERGERVEPEPLYAVAFRSDDIFGAGNEPPWTVALDLWESYLEPVETT